MADDVLTFEELRRVQSEERQSDTLQELDPAFFDRARNYLELKREGGDHLQNQEFRNARNILQDIMDLRQKKIVKLAFLSVKSGVTVENMLPHEEELFEAVEDAIGSYRDERIDAVFDADEGLAGGGEDRGMDEPGTERAESVDTADTDESEPGEQPVTAVEDDDGDATAATADGGEPDAAVEGDDAAEPAEAAGDAAAGEDVLEGEREEAGETEEEADTGGGGDVDGADVMEEDAESDDEEDGSAAESILEFEGGGDDETGEQGEEDDDVDALSQGGDGADGDETENASDGDIIVGGGREDDTETGDADDRSGDGGDGAEADGEDDATDESESEPDEDDGKVPVRVTEEVPEFMGTDLTAYGPFEPGEEVRLPAENADVLEQQGKAERV
ncbi:MAG: hypothetical protein ABEI97_02440 [Candidatus Nanohaloarchaea archaeon]